MLMTWQTVHYCYKFWGISQFWQNAWIKQCWFSFSRWRVCWTVCWNSCNPHQQNSPQFLQMLPKTWQTVHYCYKFFWISQFWQNAWIKQYQLSFSRWRVYWTVYWNSCNPHQQNSPQFLQMLPKTWQTVHRWQEWFADLECSSKDILLIGEKWKNLASEGTLGLGNYWQCHFCLSHSIAILQWRHIPVFCSLRRLLWTVLTSWSGDPDAVESGGWDRSAQVPGWGHLEWRLRPGRRQCRVNWHLGNGSGWGLVRIPLGGSSLPSLTEQGTFDWTGCCQCLPRYKSQRDCCLFILLPFWLLLSGIVLGRNGLRRTCNPVFPTRPLSQVWEWCRQKWIFRWKIIISDIK